MKKERVRRGLFMDSNHQCRTIGVAKHETACARAGSETYNAAVYLFQRPVEKCPMFQHVLQRELQYVLQRVLLQQAPCH